MSKKILIVPFFIFSFVLNSFAWEMKNISGQYTASDLFDPDADQLLMTIGLDGSLKFEENLRDLGVMTCSTFKNGGKGKIINNVFEAKVRCMPMDEIFEYKIDFNGVYNLDSFVGKVTFSLFPENPISYSFTRSKNKRLTNITYPKYLVGRWDEGDKCTLTILKVNGPETEPTSFSIKTSFSSTPMEVKKIGRIGNAGIEYRGKAKYRNGRGERTYTLYVNPKDKEVLFYEIKEESVNQSREASCHFIF